MMRINRRDLSRNEGLKKAKGILLGTPKPKKIRVKKEVIMTLTSIDQK